ncbi:MAG: DUF5916 domain-containing protein [Bacteroidota bacterium]|nr:DUF5916 domain-containing protein [Bacteroidota bacterium]
MKKWVILVIFILSAPFFCLSQEQKKKIQAIQVSSPPKIDGILNEKEWQEAPPATDFIQRIPYNGQPSMYRTEVRFLYDNTGLYVGAMMYDPHPDSISTQMGLRDVQILNADYFLLLLSPFNDGINAFCFQVYSSDIQGDFKLPSTLSTGEDDYTWDAVWISKARKNEQGWVVEMKIPYSAIRFPKLPVQDWTMNIQRDIHRYREVSTWNLIDSKVSGYVNQCGILEGFHDLKPPLRLSLTPYVSGYMEKNPENPEWKFPYNFGADLKLGLDQSFTLDMTLIPDFGQVPYDDKVYNLTPYEIRYDEKRQFFTEGTELFNKAGIFYSRRIGGTPKEYSTVSDSLRTNEKIKENPLNTRLINATKISGRTDKGLGIGFFNAMSSNTWATIEDTITGKTRKFMTQGFTNYNMFVLDQALKYNSYIDFDNTNYYITGKGYCANVTGTVFRFANRKNTYAFSGNAFVSQKYYSHTSPDVGYHYNVGYGKISGNFLFHVNQWLETDNYDPNDMGYNERNNIFSNEVYFQYNIYKPFGKFLSWYNYYDFQYNTLYDDLKYTSFYTGYETHLTTMKHLDFGLTSDVLPVPYHDYFEPRVSGHMYIQPALFRNRFWISTDYRKPLAWDAWFSQEHRSGKKADEYLLGISPRVRISDRFLVVFSATYDYYLNNTGYVLDSVNTGNQTVILFGRRDLQTITNVLTVNYMVAPMMSLDLRLRHYWITADYKEFYRLDNDGRLAVSPYSGNQDINYNLFNLDLSYTWNFAPGSQLSVVWKNSVTHQTDIVERNYFTDFRNTLDFPASNSLSVRVLYYLDANYLKTRGTGQERKEKS